MAADDVYLAMVGLEDQERAERVAAGDWSALGDLDLTDDERAMVEDLVEERTAEVSGFRGGAWFQAMNYTSMNVSPGVARRFPPSAMGLSPSFMTCGGSSCSECKGKMPGSFTFG